MAKAIGEGSHFFGLPVTQGRVLYIEVDTPLHSLHERLKHLPPTPDVWFLHTTPLSLPFIQPEGEEMELLRDGVSLKPDVVFVNTLRKVHDLDDKDSKTPKVVYSFFQKLFPGAALVVVHHERKRSTDPKAVYHDNEGFSGAKNWLNDAQTGLHLETYKGGESVENLRLYHIKSQVSGKLRPLPLHLGEDGTTLTSPLYTELLKVYEWVQDNSDLPSGEKDTLLAKVLGVSVTTAKRRRLAVEGGLFPGSRAFLESFGERA